ncbi:hypothetical protein [Streptomyces sp. H27-D2]|uniref:hypothetical protein n=1 Tax=Streptomyces sp. H27-D2 TaxID=3046304 RepID=UPI002DB7B7BC|nr:hypothetical protein [Streptomyces sp. H27-D2]MEC4018641.1 hypothetical protein [Streptomyces sp. H27-D2]
MRERFVLAERLLADGHGRAGVLPPSLVMAKAHHRETPASKTATATTPRRRSFDPHQEPISMQPPNQKTSSTPAAEPVPAQGKPDYRNVFVQPVYPDGQPYENEEAENAELPTFR